MHQNPTESRKPVGYNSKFLQSILGFLTEVPPAL